MSATVQSSDCNRDGIITLGAFRTFANLPGPGVRTANFAAFGSQSDALLKNAESHRDSDALMRVAVPRRRGPAGLRDLFLLLSELWPTHHVFSAFRMCETRGGITTLGPFRTFTNIPGSGIRTAYFAALGAWSGVLPKNAGSLGTAMRLCASLFRRRRGPDGLRDLFLLLSELRLTHHGFSAFRMCETWGGITTLGVLCVLLKRWTAACQKGLFAVF